MIGGTTKIQKSSFNKNVARTQCCYVIYLQPISTYYPRLPVKATKFYLYHHKSSAKKDFEPIKKCLP